MDGEVTSFVQDRFLIDSKSLSSLKLTLGLDLFSTLVSNPDREFKKEMLKKFPFILIESLLSPIHVFLFVLLFDNLIH